MTAPEPAPLPPLDLDKRAPAETILQPGEVVYRFYTAAFEPIYFDCGHDGRLNTPDGSYGVLYVAQSARGAFAETFLRTPGRTLLPADLLARKALVTLEVTRLLRLARLAGTGLARVGATAQVTHGGKPYDVPQAWSAAFHAHPNRYDGIAYNARHDDEAVCYALFDHTEEALREQSRVIDLDQDWFWELAELYGVGLAP